MYIAIARHENIAAYKALRMVGIEPTEANMRRYIECEYLSFEVKADGKYYCCYNDGLQSISVEVSTLKAN